MFGFNVGRYSKRGPRPMARLKPTILYCVFIFIINYINFSSVSLKLPISEYFNFNITYIGIYILFITLRRYLKNSNLYHKLLLFLFISQITYGLVSENGLHVKFKSISNWWRRSRTVSIRGIPPLSYRLLGQHSRLRDGFPPHSENRSVGNTEQ